MTRRFQLSPLFLVAAGLFFAAFSDAQATECRYDVVVSDASASELSVSLECDGGLPARLGMKSGAAGWVGTLILADGSALETDLDGWSIPAGERSQAARYTLPLGAMAGASGRYNAAMKIGNSILVQLDSWLAVPEPAGDYTLVISIAMPGGGDVATSLQRDGEGYRLAARELDRAGYFVFGTFKRTDVTLPAPGSLAAGTTDTTVAHLIVLDGRMTPTLTDFARWVEYTGRAAAEFWRGFPMDEPFIVVVPESGRGVEQGRVLPGLSVMTLLHVGRETPAASLYAEPVMVHEMVHLGSPSIEDNGDWLNEGIAMYFETIIRARAGWLTREDVWHEWVTSMPKGLEALGETGLAKADETGIYWGGALFMLLADIELRKSSGLRLGLEDCARAARDAGGTMDQDWTPKQFLDVCDATYGNTIVSDLAARYVKPGKAPTLSALWKQLGVVAAKDGSVHFDDTAPLAAVRDAILSGGPDAQWKPVLRPDAPAVEPSTAAGKATVTGADIDPAAGVDEPCRMGTGRDAQFDCP